MEKSFAFLSSDTNQPEAGQSNVENCVFKYHFKPFRKEVDIPAALQKAQAIDHQLTQASYTRVLSAIQNKIEGTPLGCITEDMLDVEYIVNNYTVNYEDFVHSLVFASKVDNKMLIITMVRQFYSR